MPVAAKKGKEIKKIDREEVFCRTGLRVITEEERNLLALKMTKAGIKEKPEHLWGKKIIYTASYVLFVTLLSLLTGLNTGIMFFLYLGAIITWLYPNIQLNSAIEKRKFLLKKDLPKFSIFLSTALNSMSNVPQALSVAGKYTENVYAEEIGIVIKENHSGKSLTDALYDWAQRTDVEEINSLVSVLDEIHVKGVPAAERMKEYSDRMRMIRRFEIMDQAGKVSIKLIFIVLMFMLVPTMMVIGYPAAYSLLKAL